MNDTLRACWYKPTSGPRTDMWTLCRFHQWGTEAAIAEGDGFFSIAIVEDERTHDVVTVVPERIRFVASTGA